MKINPSRETKEYMIKMTCLAIMVTAAIGTRCLVDPRFLSNIQSMVQGSISSGNLQSTIFQTIVDAGGIAAIGSSLLDRQPTHIASLENVKALPKENQTQLEVKRKKRQDQIKANDKSLKKLKAEIDKRAKLIGPLDTPIDSKEVKEKSNEDWIAEIRSRENLINEGRAQFEIQENESKERKAQIEANEKWIAEMNAKLGL